MLLFILFAAFYLQTALCKTTHIEVEDRTVSIVKHSDKNTIEIALRGKDRY